MSSTGVEYTITTTAIEHIQYVRSLDSAVGGKIYSSYSPGGVINNYIVVFGTSSTDGNIGLQVQGPSYIASVELDSSTNKVTIGAGNVQLGTASAVKVYLGGSTYYLYLNGSDLYWWNGSTGTKLN